MTDDVVAELDEWLEREATTLKHYPADDVDTGLLQRGRHEIAALRERCTVSDVDILIEVGRNEALEEAARVCERADKSTHPATCADMIRALKDRGG